MKLEQLREELEKEGPQYKVERLPDLSIELIYVGTGMMPAENEPEGMKTVTGPSPTAINRHGSWLGPTAASFQVKPPDAPPKGDLDTAEAYGRRVATITLQLVKGRS